MITLRSSDRHSERRWHYVAAAFLAAGGLGFTAMMQGNLVGSLIGMSIAKDLKRIADTLERRHV